MTDFYHIFLNPALKKYSYNSKIIIANVIYTLPRNIYHLFIYFFSENSLKFHRQGGPRSKDPFCPKIFFNFDD